MPSLKWVAFQKKTLPLVVSYSVKKIAHSINKLYWKNIVFLYTVIVAPLEKEKGIKKGASVKQLLVLS